VREGADLARVNLRPVQPAVTGSTVNPGQVRDRKHPSPVVGNFNIHGKKRPNSFMESGFIIKTILFHSQSSGVHFENLLKLLFADDFEESRKTRSLFLVDKCLVCCDEELLWLYACICRHVEYELA
jgi:hypothetical protein